MKRANENAFLSDEHGLRSMLGENPNGGSRSGNDGSADEDHGEWSLAELRARLATLVAVDLPTVSVALDGDIEET